MKWNAPSEAPAISGRAAFATPWAWAVEGRSETATTSFSYLFLSIPIISYPFLSIPIISYLVPFLCSWLFLVTSDNTCSKNRNFTFHPPESNKDVPRLRKVCDWLCDEGGAPGPGDERFLIRSASLVNAKVMGKARKNDGKIIEHPLFGCKDCLEIVYQPCSKSLGMYEIHWNTQENYHQGDGSATRWDVSLSEGDKTQVMYSHVNFLWDQMGVSMVSV